MDKQIKELIIKEAKRQEQHIELIASENYVSKEVLEVTGSILTNKYAEGYPGKRYYDGCEIIDQIEISEQDRLKKLFNVKYVNIQPHSWPQANAAAIATMIEPDQNILGMSLDAGGHLTHGYKVNFSSRFYQTDIYGVDDNGIINFDDVLKKLKGLNLI